MIWKSVTTCEKYRVYNTVYKVVTLQIVMNPQRPPTHVPKMCHTRTPPLSLSCSLILKALHYHNGRQLWPVNLPWLSAVEQGRISMGVCGEWGGGLHSAYHGPSVLAAHVPRGKETLWRTTFSPVGLGPHTYKNDPAHINTQNRTHREIHIQTPSAKKTQILKFSILFNILKN